VIGYVPFERKVFGTHQRMVNVRLYNEAIAQKGYKGLAFQPGHLRIFHLVVGVVTQIVIARHYDHAGDEEKKYFDDDIFHWSDT